MFFSALLLALLLALSITRSPVEVRSSPILPLTRRLDFSNDTIDLVQHDKARVAAFRDYHTHGRRVESIPIRLTRWSRYTAALEVGIPPTTYNIIVDSGSAVTWIGGRTSYDETGINTGQRVREFYGEGRSRGSFSGTIFQDTVTLGGELTIPNYELAVASRTKNIRSDGILGIGPRDLTVNTLRGKPGTYPTFTECLVDEDAIGKNLVGIFFQPITGDPDTNVGELAFGEPDYTKCIDNIVYTPITDIPLSSKFWGIKQSITYGDTEILGDFPGIIDTGSKYIYLASDAYNRYKAATGATLDPRTALLRVTSQQYSDLRELKFHIENVILTLNANAQIWPRSLNSKLPGGENDGIYLIIGSLSAETGAGTGLDFIIGYTFMQRFYTVLDGDNRQVGFARTSFTDAIIN